MISQQIADRAEKLAELEADSRFKAYCSECFARAEKALGWEIPNKEDFIPVLEEAAEKGLRPETVADRFVQAYS
jgi:hypothetical protein